MSEVHVRRAGPADIEALERHVQAGFDSYVSFAPDGWSPPRVGQDRARTLSLLAAPDTQALMATVDDAPAGHVAFIPGRERAVSEAAGEWQERPLVPGLAHLWQLFVLPPWWGTGVGSELHVAMRAAMLASGMTHARLYTPAAHLRARRFYERRGWRSGEQSFNPGLGLELVEYRLDLSAPEPA